MALLKGAHRTGAYTVALVAIMLLAHQAAASSVKIVKPKVTTYPATCTEHGATKINYDVSAFINDQPATPTCCPSASDGLYGIFKIGGPYTIRCSIYSPDGDYAQVKFNITVADQSAPKIQVVKPSITIPAQGPSSSYDYRDNIVASDNCNPHPTVVCTASGSAATTYPVASGLPVGSTTITCTAKDGLLESDPVSFVIVVEDKVAPVLPKALTDLTVIELEATSTQGAPLPPGVTFTGLQASDNVDGAVSVQCTSSVGAIPTIFPIGNTSPTTTTVTCTATDAAGNTATHTLTVIVKDTTPPELIVPEIIVVTATNKNGDPAIYIPTVSDIVDPAPVVVCTPPSGTIFELGKTTTVSCTATDKYGNPTTKTFPVKVQDVVPPRMPLGPLTLEAEDETSGILPPYQDAIDDVWGPTPLDCDKPAGTSVTNGTIVKCKSTDGSGNTAFQDYPVVVLTPPSELILQVPADKTSPAGPGGSANFQFQPVASDILKDPKITVTCTNNVNQVITPVPDPPADLARPTYSVTLGLGATTVTCTAKNRIGKTATGSFVLTVVDTTPPVITCRDVEAKATSPFTTVNWQAGLDYSDDVSSKDVLLASLVCTDAPAGNSFAPGTYGIKCTVKDGALNSAETTCNVKVVDDEAPSCSIVEMASVYKLKNPAAGQVVTYQVTSRDNVATNMVPTCSDASGTNFAVGTDKSITCTVTDKSGNSGTCSFPFKVIDDADPILSVPGATIIEATQSDPDAKGWAIFNYASNVTAITWNNIPLTPTCTPASGSVFGPVNELTVITCTAEAPNGNKATATFTVLVKDTRAPTTTAPANKVLTADKNGEAKYVIPKPVAVDVDGVDPDPVVSCDVEIGKEQTFKLPAGQSSKDYTITCRATDKFGNVGDKVSYTVTIQKAPAPRVTCPANIVQPLQNGKSTEVTYTTATASTSDQVTCDKPSPVTVTLGSDVTVTCSAESVSGDKDSCSFTIAVKDNAPPQCTPPSNKVYDADARGGVYVKEQELKGSADDLVEGHVPLTCTWPGQDRCKSGKCLFPVGVTKISCSAKDSSGNTCTAEATVTVTDTKPPCVAPFCYSACATSKQGRTVDVRSSATDDVDGSLPVSGTGRKLFPLGLTVVTLSAKDKAGNVGYANATIQIKDCQPPKVKPPQDKEYTVYCDNSDTIAFRYSPCTATDDFTSAADLTKNMKYSHAAGYKFPIGKTVVTCSTNDNAGNVGFASFVVNVKSTADRCRQLQDEVNKAKPCGLAEAVKDLHLAYKLKHPEQDKCNCHKAVTSVLTAPNIKNTLGGQFLKIALAYNRIPKPRSCSSGLRSIA